MTTALTNLYVRNLPMEWTAADLIALGEKYGPVVSAKVLYNPLTTASRGMGFIRFAEHADATLAIAGMNGHIPDSAVHAKPLNVQFAKDQQMGGSASRSAESNRYSPYPTAKRAAGAPGGEASSVAAVGFVESLPVAPEGTDPLNVYVVDLPLSFTKEEFHALYEPFGSLVTSTVLTDPTSGQSRGIGFARYSNKDNAARALKETQGMLLQGAAKPLLVRFARDSSRKHDEQASSSAQRPHSHGPHQPPPPLQSHGAPYSSSYAPHYPYAPTYAPAPAPYYPHYPPQLASPQHHRAALPAPPMPQPAAAASLAAVTQRPNSSTHPAAAAAAADGSPAVAAASAAYQQAWAAYYAQLGYPGYYSPYQYPATAYPAPPYTYHPTQSAAAAPAATGVQPAPAALSTNSAAARTSADKPSTVGSSAAGQPSASSAGPSSSSPPSSRSGALDGATTASLSAPAAAG